MASAKDLVESTINDNFVAFFSKSTCPYCRRAKGVINELNLGDDKPVKIYECVPRARPWGGMQRLLMMVLTFPGAD